MYYDEDTQVEWENKNGNHILKIEAPDLILNVIATDAYGSTALAEAQPTGLSSDNDIKAAIEIYLNVAKTGQLPKTLPEGLPKDPSTGRDFIYEITDEGFALRCQDEKFLSSPSEELEFKVKK